jgi:hypothetical protein
MVKTPPNKKAKGIAKIQFDDILDDESYDFESSDIKNNDKPSSLVWWSTSISSHGFGQLEHGVVMSVLIIVLFLITMLIFHQNQHKIIYQILVILN